MADADRESGLTKSTTPIRLILVRSLHDLVYRAASRNLKTSIRNCAATANLRRRDDFGLQSRIARGYLERFSYCIPGVRISGIDRSQSFVGVEAVSWRQRFARNVKKTDVPISVLPAGNR